MVLSTGSKVVDVNQYIKFTELKQAAEGGDEMAAPRLDDEASAALEGESLNATIESLDTSLTENSKRAGATKNNNTPKPNNNNDEASKPENKIQNVGFSTLCEFMLGKSLDKTEQCSDWSRRPLRPLQVSK